MSQLQKYGEVYIPPESLNKLSLPDKRVALSLSPNDNPRYSEMNLSEVNSLLENILLKSRVKLGLKANPDEKKAAAEAKVLMQVIDEDLNTLFPGLRRSEIYAATDAGLNGDFLPEGETKVFFNPSQLVQWIKAWIEKVKKPVVIKLRDLSHQVKDEDRVITERESIISSFNFFMNVCVEHKENGRVYQDYGLVVYEFLVKFGMMEKVTNDEILESAQQLLFEAKVSRDKPSIRDLGKFVEEFRNDSDTSKEHIPFKHAARKLVSNEIRTIGGYSEDGFIEYLQDLKIICQDYIKDNNL